MSPRRNNSELFIKVRDYMEDHPNVELTTDTVRRGVGSPDRHAVTNILGAMSRAAGHGIQRAGRGAYFFDPMKKSANPEPLYQRYKAVRAAADAPRARKRQPERNGVSERDLMEVVRIRVGGEVVLVDAEGEIYVARHVDL